METGERPGKNAPAMALGLFRAKNKIGLSVREGGPGQNADNPKL
jgi:hypothetical protein